MSKHIVQTKQYKVAQVVEEMKLSLVITEKLKMDISKPEMQMLSSLTTPQTTIYKD